MELTSNTYERFYEIAFVKIFSNLSRDMPNDKLDYFLENFCKVYDIDYTSMSIIINMYLKKMVPSKMEVALFSKITDIPIVKLPLDYRTYRKYVKMWELGGKVELHPNIINAYLKPVIKTFVDKFIGLMYDDIAFIKHLKEVDTNEIKKIS